MIYCYMDGDWEIAFAILHTHVFQLEKYFY